MTNTDCRRPEEYVRENPAITYQQFKRTDKLKWSKAALPLKNDVTRFVRENAVDDMCGCRGDCDSKCLNRITFMECTNKTCRNVNCSNRVSQRPDFNTREYFESFAKIVNFGTGKGRGVIATRDIPKGEILLEYIGEVVTSAEFDARLDEKGYNAVYGMSLHTGLVIDAKEIGSETRFLNHSCAPNCESTAWIVGNQKKVLVHAVRPITVGEELTFCYQMEFPRTLKELPKCYCSAGALCQGTMGTYRPEPGQKKAKAPSAGLSRRQSQALLDEIPKPVEVQQLAPEFGGLKAYCPENDAPIKPSVKRRASDESTALPMDDEDLSQRSPDVATPRTAVLRRRSSLGVVAPPAVGEASLAPAATAVVAKQLFKRGTKAALVALPSDEEEEVDEAPRPAAKRMRRIAA